ncbi:leucine--tRNA ligase [Flavobacteriaceae bacterium]|nr:leucine--tRNA ligase [Flavobacteriaceae bacterium]
MNYNFRKIEKKWQTNWVINKTYKSEIDTSKPKFYSLDMFPYPSGAGLHVGHPLGYIASDIYSRYKKLKGFNVLHPQGYDSFGLPAEQYAIQTGQHPKTTTLNNINTYRSQLDKIGFSFDWSRELITSDPNYYKWTQWIFIQLFNSWYDYEAQKAKSIEELIIIFSTKGNDNLRVENDSEIEIFTSSDWSNFSDEQKQKTLLSYRIAYLADSEVNWCAELGTVLANDEIVNGVSERGGYQIEKRKMRQWNMRISSYADRLLNDLDKIDWSYSIKETQKNWIGKSTGCSVFFDIVGFEEKIEVFTTRPDTIFGVSFMTLAPEHELVSQIVTIDNKEEIENYIKLVSAKSERDRISNVKSITGVFTGSYAEHPITKKPIEIWIGDYVLASYGTGAVMSVPCGDQRDYDFAKKYNINIINIFKDIDISMEAFTSKENFILDGSDFLNGMSFDKANQKAIDYIEENRFGNKKVNFRLRDAIFSRQRYWGEPFPVYYKKGLPYMIEETCLPLKLPEIEKYLPTKDGDPPLGRASEWAWDTVNNKTVSTSMINNTTIFPIELNTMPGWAGSSWYFLRYTNSSEDNNSVINNDGLSYWKNVDLYIGGNEHATGHLLYSRFWTKFLFDRKFIDFDEPFKKLINQGMILGSSAIIYRESKSKKFISKELLKNQVVDEIHIDVNLINASDEVDIDKLKSWQPQFKNAEFELVNDRFKVCRKVEKMSKRWYNVVNPDLICEQYGADSLRLFEMFLGPLEQYKPWNTAGISGVHNFLKKLWKLYTVDSGLRNFDLKPSKENLKTLHTVIKKVENDIENFSFNTPVSCFMIAVNELTAQKCNSKEILEPLLILLSPYVPHICEELWEMLGHSTSITFESFPIFDSSMLVESTKTYPISINGKVRLKIELSLGLSKEEIEKIILNNPQVISKLEGEPPKRVIVIPGKIINLVI